MTFSSDWDMGRYAHEIRSYNEKLAPSAKIRFDDGYDCAVTISQSVVQDVFHLIRDVQEIRKKKVECEFLRIKPGSSDATASEFIVLVWHRLDVSITPFPMPPTKSPSSNSSEMSKYGDTMAQLITGDARLNLAFEAPPRNGEDHNCWRARQISMDKFYSTGADMAIKIRRPCTRDDRGPRSKLIKAFDSHAKSNKVTGEFYLKFNDEVDQAKRRVLAVRPLWEDPPLSDDIENALPAYQKAIENDWKASLLAGSGFPGLVFPRAPLDNLKTDPATKADDIRKTKEAMESVRSLQSLPKVDIFNFQSAKSEALMPHIKDGVGGETYDRFRRYMDVNKLGVIPIIGFAGSGE